jgi:hypothetical protein
MEAPMAGSAQLPDPMATGRVATVCTDPWKLWSYALLAIKFSFVNTSPPTPAELPRPQTDPSRTDELPSLQYGGWVEAKAYDEDLPTCIHY